MFSISKIQETETSKKKAEMDTEIVLDFILVKVRLNNDII